MTDESSKMLKRFENGETHFEDRELIVENHKKMKVAVDCFLDHEPGTFDLILMDIMMPVMDGMNEHLSKPLDENRMMKQAAQKMYENKKSSR